MVKSKFPVVPVLIVVAALGAVLYVNLREHPTAPNPQMPVQGESQPAPTAQDISASLKNTNKRPMTPPGQSGTDAAGLTEDASTPVYKPQPTDSSITGEWYSNEAIKKFPHQKAPARKKMNSPQMSQTQSTSKG